MLVYVCGSLPLQAIWLNAWCEPPIEEGLNYCTCRRQGKGRRIRLGDRILAALAVWPQSIWNKRMSSTVPLATLAVLARSFWNKWLSSTSNVELNRFFQIDWSKTASAATARILSPNPTQRPLPCLRIQSFFYGAILQLFSFCCWTNVVW